MFRFIIPIILIGTSVAGFLMFTQPFYQEISLLRTKVKSYNEALDNSKALENEREKLNQKVNSITPENLEKLEKLLPNNVDNIRLILEIEKIAAPYGMVLKDVRYNTIQKDNTDTVVPGGESASALSDRDYGTLDLSFSTQGNYNNLLLFIKDLENNLRIVDISSIEFSSIVGPSDVKPMDIYTYKFKIKTYWLKN